MVQQWSTFFLQKGFLSGLNFLGEYIQSIGWSEPHKLKNVEVMSEYFANEPEESKDQRFRNILAAYIRLLYPVGNILPIGHNYQDFPFVIFRSYSLKEVRQKIFTDKYLLSSNELNVLNLILSQEALLD